MAASRIRGITIEIGGDTSKLVSALSKVDAAIKETQTNLRDIERALKIDPTNVNLLKDKQRELSDAVENAKEKLEAEKQALDELKNSDGFDKNSKEAKDLQTQIDLDTVALQRAEQQLIDFGSVGQQQWEAVGKKIQEVGDKVKGVGDRISQIGQDLTTKVTVPIVTAFGSAIKVTADFDAEMSKVQAISGATGEEFDQLRAKARELGAETKFSATEAAQGFEYMGMAGWKTEDMLDGISGIMNLAAASGEELATTSDIVTDALTAFGMEASESGRFADILAAAATNANTNVAMMGESFKYVAPVAGSLGYTAEDVAVALGLMANSGIKADMAGTSLRNMFQRMAKPTKESQAAMDRLGLSLTDSEGRMYSFREIMDQMRSSFSEINMSAEEYDKVVAQLDQDLADGTIKQKEYDKELEELNKQAFGAEGAEKARAAAMLGGTRAMSGLLAIANTTEEDYNKLTQAIDNSSESFAKLADGSVVPLNEALASGQEVLETYSGQAEAMAATMQDNLTGDITKLKSQIQELAISFGDLLMPTIREIVEKIQGFVDVLNSMDEAQKEQIIKIAAIVTAIGPLLMVIGHVVSAVGTIISMAGALTTALAGISAPVLIVVGVIAALAAAFVSLYQNSETFREKVDTTFAGLKEKFSEMWAALQPIFQEIGVAFQEIMTTLEPVFTFLLDTFAAIVEGVMTAVPDIIGAIQNGIQFISEIIQAFAALFKGDFDGLAEHLKGAWQAVSDFISNLTKAFIDSILGSLGDFGVDLKQIIANMAANFKETWSNIVNAAKTYASNVATNIIEGIGRGIDWIKSLPSQAWQWGADIINNIANGIRAAISTVTDAISSVADVISSYIHFSEPDVGPLSNFHTFMPDMMKEMVQGIRKGIPMLEDAMNTMTTSMVPNMPTAGSAAGNQNFNASNTFNITINGAGKDILQLGNELTEIVADNINNQIFNREAAFR